VIPISKQNESSTKKATNLSIWLQYPGTSGIASVRNLKEYTAQLPCPCFITGWFEVLVQSSRHLFQRAILHWKEVISFRVLWSEGRDLDFDQIIVPL
jgi:hypothetical protein